MTRKLLRARGLSRGYKYMIPSLCLYASQLASCIGHNRFKKSSDALELVWQRVAPHSFSEALRRNGLFTVDDAVERIASANQVVRHLLVEAEATASATSGDVAASYEEASRQLAAAPNLTPEEHKLVDDAMKKTLYTSFGNRQEDAVFQYIRERHPCVLDDTFYKRHLMDVDGVPVFIGGRIDAISEDGSTILEIKNRINRLFFKIPTYEHIQVLAYLFAVPHASRATLVECITRDNGSLLTHAVPIHWDDAFWEDVVVSRVRNFVRLLLKILRDPVAQDTYLKNPRRATHVAYAIAGKSLPRERSEKNIQNAV